MNNKGRMRKKGRKDVERRKKEGKEGSAWKEGRK